MLQVIEEIHTAFLEAGADILETNTFNGTTISQSDYELDIKEEVPSGTYPSTSCRVLCNPDHNILRTVVMHVLQCCARFCGWLAIGTHSSLRPAAHDALCLPA